MDFTMIAPAECLRDVCDMEWFEDAYEVGLVSWDGEMASGRKVGGVRGICDG